MVLGLLLIATGDDGKGRWAEITGAVSDHTQVSGHLMAIPEPNEGEVFSLRMTSAP